MVESKACARQSGHVLVLGRDIRAFLSVIRSLGRASLTIHVGMCPLDDLALKSRYVSHVHDIPDYNDASSEWLDVIIELAKSYNFDLIVPTHDESTIPVQLHQEELGKYAGVYSLDPSVFEIAFDKIKSSLLVDKLGIRVAKQLSIELSVLETGLPEGFNFPIVIKPPSSYVSEDLSVRREVMVASNRAQLNDILPKLHGWKTALIQEHFAGVGTGIEVLVKDGEVLYAFQHLRVHEPRTGGASSYRKSVVPMNPELISATKTLMAEIGYTGVAMVEYKINPLTGDWIFIEINGRFWGSLPLALASGADFPKLLYDLIVNDTLPSIPPARSEVYCRNIKRDLYWAIDNLKDRFSEQPSKYSVSLPSMASEYFRLLTFREHVDSFTLDDPAPALTEFREVASMMAAKSLSIARRNIRSFGPIHKRRQKLIRRLSKSANNINFVCSGNICRSPFAAGYAAEVLPTNTVITSTGFHEVTNRAPPAQAVQSAAELGVDLSSHRSMLIDDLAVRSSDLIFVFEEKHMVAFHQKFPFFSGEIFYLGDMIPGSEFEIADPYGGGNDRFREIYLSIVQALDYLDSRYD